MRRRVVPVVLAAQEPDMIKCPKCNSPENYVKQTRYQEQWNQLRRVRACKSCGHDFQTFENVDDEGDEG